MRYLLILLAACGGSDGNATPDAAPIVDAPSGGNCLVPAGYGALGAKTGTTAQGPTTLTVVLDPGPPRDSFFLKLNAGKGVFAGGLANGTYSIAGAELSQATCGMCVNIIADIVTGQGPTKFYFATAGSVTLTSTSPPAGTLSNVMLREVDVAGNPTGSSCTSVIDSMSFSQ